MSVTYKDIDAYTKKASVAGDEKIPVSSSEYITPDQIRPVPAASTQPAGGMLPNVLYNFGELSGDTTFSLASAVDQSVANHYFWTFEVGATVPTVSWPSGLTWSGGSSPTVAANKHYEISVLGGIAVYLEV